jgi:hypothetical protein
LQDLGVDLKVILKWITKKLDGRAWTGFIWLSIENRGRTQGGLGCQDAAPPEPPNPKLKKHIFVDIMISKVLRDFPFSRNQPLKSADN